MSPYTADYQTQIAMTRSIGDFYANAGGLIPEPDVTVLEMQTCPFVMVGSDGAFDTINVKGEWMDKDTIVGNTVLSVKDTPLQQVVQTRVDLLWQLFKDMFGSKNDDVSLAVLCP